MTKEKFRSLTYIFFWSCFSAAVFAIYSSRKADTFPFFRAEDICLILFIFFVCKKFNLRNFPVILFVGSFFVRVLAVLIMNNEPYSDFKLMYEAAEMLARGDISFNETQYFTRWAYQTGFVVWEAGLLKICNSILFLKLVNCALSAGIHLLIFYIVKEIFASRTAAATVSAVYMVFPFSVLHTNVLTNSHVSAFFLFLGIWLLLRKEDTLEGESGRFGRVVKKELAAGICVAIGNIFRPDGIIVLVAMAAKFIYEVINKKITIPVFFKRSAAFFAIYLTVTASVSGIIVATGVNPRGLSNGDPLWKFVLGTNYESRGLYTDGDERILSQMMENDGISYEQAEKCLIKERVKEPVKIIDMLPDKINTIWWFGEGGALWYSVSYEAQEELSATVDWMTGQNRGIWICIMSLLVLGLGSWYQNCKETIGNLIIPFIVFATFSVYLVIEVQERYGYMVQIAVFIMAGGGVVFLESVLEDCRRIIHHMVSKDEKIS